MKKAKEFPFKAARRITSAEVKEARKAIEEKRNEKRQSRGRPKKGAEKYLPVSIRLHPRVMEWAKREAKKRGVGYQTIINETLLKKAA